jgi:exodeoxyribonuclease VII large subunit
MEGQGTIRDQFYFLRKKAGDLQTLTRQLVRKRKDHIEEVQQDMKARLPVLLRNQQTKLSVIDEKIRLVDPLQVLKRGYSLTYREGKLVKTIRDLNEGDELITRLHDGEVKSEIKDL